MNVWVFHVSYMRGWIHWRDNSISKSVTLYWWNYPFKESIPWMPEPLLEVLADLKSYHIKNYDSSTFFTKIMSKDRSGHIFKRMHNSRKMSTKYKAFFFKVPCPGWSKIIVHFIRTSLYIPGKVFQHFLCPIDCNLYSFYKAVLRFRWNRVKVDWLLLVLTVMACMK